MNLVAVPAFQFIFLALFLLPGIFFAITLQNTLKAISPENRQMPPSRVWFIFIPLFNIVWQFIMVNKIAKSIGAECNKLNIPVSEEKPTYGVGLAWNICNLLPFIPIIGPLAALILFIIYWTKVNQFKHLIIANEDNYMLDAERNIFYGDNIS